MCVRKFQKLIEVKKICNITYKSRKPIYSLYKITDKEEQCTDEKYYRNGKTFFS